ncbi:MAG: hypothetical protein K0S44_1883 [Bacteroidetes bacterium]|jgi:hypothetical protein|nr:hypothetical protein [Bacteroidota bacterium]
MEQKKISLAIGVIERNLAIDENIEFASEMEALAIIEDQQSRVQFAIRNNSGDRHELALRVATQLVKYSISFNHG